MSRKRASARDPVEAAAPTSDATPDPLKGLLDSVAATVDEGSIALRSGRRVEAEVAPEGDLVRVRAPAGDVVLTVLITDAGPVLRFASADIELASARRVTIACDRFDVIATDGVSLTTGGDLIERVGGDATRNVDGAAKIQADEVEIGARLHDVFVHANDDVDVRGERIRLNCQDAPMAATWDEFVGRARAAAQETPGTGQGPGR